jgi:hypothetical protein
MCTGAIFVAKTYMMWYQVPLVGTSTRVHYILTSTSLWCITHVFGHCCCPIMLMASLMHILSLGCWTDLVVDYILFILEEVWQLSFPSVGQWISTFHSFSNHRNIMLNAHIVKLVISLSSWCGFLLINNQATHRDYAVPTGCKTVSF